MQAVQQPERFQVCSAPCDINLLRHPPPHPLLCSASQHTYAPYEYEALPSDRMTAV